MMISIDKRLNEIEMDILRQLIGRKIVSLRHNKFCPIHLHAASGVVGIETNYHIYVIHKPVDSSVAVLVRMY